MCKKLWNQKSSLLTCLRFKFERPKQPTEESLQVFNEQKTVAGQKSPSIYKIPFYGIEDLYKSADTGAVTGLSKRVLYEFWMSRTSLF